MHQKNKNELAQEQVEEQQKPEKIDEADWEITPDGLYIATRGFLSRRGYCCANKCRNCPYINWRDNPAWQPVPHECVRRTRVSTKAIEGAQIMLQFHQECLQTSDEGEQLYHRSMMEHYQFLLEQWKS
jgi:hypothetical protein